MAPPIARGKSSMPKGMRAAKYGVWYGDWWVTNVATNPPAHNAAWRATATTNHFNCSRSLPCDLRNRTSSAATAAKRGRIQSTPDASDRRSNNQPAMGYGPSTISRPNISWLSDTQVSWLTMPAPTAHTSGLQRLDGSLPSGKSVGTTVKRRLVPGYQIQPRSHSAKPVAGKACPGVSE